MPCQGRDENFMVFFASFCDAYFSVRVIVIFVRYEVRYEKKKKSI